MTEQDVLDHDWELDDEPPADELPPRPRRRLLTPARGVLAAIILVAAGFIGGVEVQKSQGASAAPTARTAARTGGFARGGFGAFGGFGGGGAAPTAGQVANKRGGALYVTTASGGTVKVVTNAGSKLTRTASTSARGIYPGDTVIVTGTKRSDGTVVATRVSATAKGTRAFGGFGGGGFGGGFGGSPGGGQP